MKKEVFKTEIVIERLAAENPDKDQESWMQ